MSKEIYISTTPHETRLAIVEDDQLAEIYYERENEYTLAGSIYKGKVTRVLPGMQSAFVDVGLERDAFLYVSDFLEEQEEGAEFERSSLPPRRNDRQASELENAPLSREPGGRSAGGQDAQPSGGRGGETSGGQAGRQSGQSGAQPQKDDDEGNRRWRGRRGRGRSRGGRDRQGAPQEGSGSGNGGAGAGLEIEPVEIRNTVDAGESLPGQWDHSEELESETGAGEPGERRTYDAGSERGGERGRETGRDPGRESGRETGRDFARQQNREQGRERGQEQGRAGSPVVLPGESLSKYGGKPVERKAEGSSTSQTTAAHPSAQPSSRPSTMVEVPLTWDGSSALPGETLSKHRNRPSVQEGAKTETRQHDTAAASETVDGTAEETQKFISSEQQETASELRSADESTEPKNASASYSVDPIAPREFRNPVLEEEPAAKLEEKLEVKEQQEFLDRAHSQAQEFNPEAHHEAHAAAPDAAQQARIHQLAHQFAEQAREQDEVFPAVPFFVEEGELTEGTHHAPHADAHPQHQHPHETHPHEKHQHQTHPHETHETPREDSSAAHELAAAGLEPLPDDEAERAKHLDAYSDPHRQAERDPSAGGDSEEIPSGDQPEAVNLHAAGVMEEEVIDDEEYDFEPIHGSAEDFDSDELVEETMEHRLEADLGEVVRERHLEQRIHETDDGDAEDTDLEEDELEAGEQGYESEEADELGADDSDAEDADENDGAAAANGHQAAGQQAAAPARRRGEDRGGRGRFQRGGGGRRGGGPTRRQTQTTSFPAITELLKPGQEVLVQIAKEPIAKKGARITSHIALPGRFLVYMPTVNHVGVSRKISSDEERQRLKRILVSEKGDANGGFIVRTAAGGANEQELRADIRFLINLWNEIKQRSDSGPSPALIYHDLNLVERVLRDQVTDRFSVIWVDTETEYERVVRFLNRFQPSLVRSVKLYTKDTPLFEQFGIQEEINKALRSKVWLKSGGSIVINQTEALVAIDINTGKYVGKTARLEDTILKTNLDSIPEIVRQIRLRDLGGIIVIDFIDMDERKNRHKVMQALEEGLKADRAPSKVLQFNDFGLVAITRKRVKQSLERTLSVQCEICQGTGMVKSPVTVCNEIFVELRKMQHQFDRGDILLRVNPDVVKQLKTQGARWLQEMEELIGKTIVVKSDPALHPEQFDIH